MTLARVGSALRRNSRAFWSASAAGCRGRAPTLMPGRVSASWPSGVHPRAVAEVEPDRLHHPECGALGENVGAGEHARVLLDHRFRGEARGFVEVAPGRGPLVLAVVSVVAPGIDRAA